jgi:hypothetical protein
MTLRWRFALPALATLLGAGVWQATRGEPTIPPATHVEPVSTEALGSRQAEPLVSAAQPPTKTAVLLTRAPPPVMPALLDEPALMSELRRARDSDPELSLSLARDGNRRFPDSVDAPERASIIVHALSKLGRTSEGRGEAEEMVNRYPDSEWVREVERFTGAHRHRNVRTNALGQLEYY